MAAECGVARHNGLLLLGLLLIIQQELVLSRTVCKLSIEGFESNLGIKTMRLACTGGSIIASAHPNIQGNLSRSFSGVVWSDQGACGALQSFCALTICGDSKATFLDPSIVQVNASKMFSYVLCIGDSSDLLFRRAQFVHNTARLIISTGQAVHLHIQSSTIINNTTPWTNGYFGLLHLMAGSTVVKSSRVQGNTGTGDCGIFCVRHDSSLQLESSELQDNKGANSGGAVSVLETAHIKVHNCSFNHNRAVFGGAMLLFNNSTGNISHCNFSGNHANATGGAVYFSDSVQADLQNSRFEGNAAGGYAGGAVGLWMHAKVDMDNAYFNGNIAAKLGGAVMVSGSASLTVTDASLEHNSAGQGSAVFVNGNSTVRMQNVHFAHNNSTDSGTLSAWDDATVSLMHVVFAHNTARFAAGVDAAGFSTVHLLASTLANNTVARTGAALYVSDNSSMHVQSCTIANNTAGEHGGGMYVEGHAIVTILESVLTGNRAGSASGWGGAVLTNASAHVNLARVKVLWNTAGFGGALTFLADSLLTARGVVVAYNSAIDGAGVYVDQKAAVDIQHSRLVENSASSRGGAMALFDMATCNVVGCGLVQNSAKKGGALFLGGAEADKHGAHMSVHNSTLRGNVALDSGGALRGYGRVAVTFVSCLFVNNSASYGGAISLSEHAAVVMEGQSRGLDNSADQGGFINMMDNSSAHVSNALFMRNWVRRDGLGGLVRASGTSFVTVENCHAVGGVLQPGVYGGAVNIDSYAHFDISGSTLSEYIAARGAGIALFDNSTVHGRDCTMVNMTATNDGGGLMVASSAQSSWVDGGFVHTSALNGGAIKVTGAGRVNVFRVVFRNATGHDGGGAVSVAMAAAITLTDCRFQGCQTSTVFGATSSGGALLAEGTASANLTNCAVTQCRGVYGGAVSAVHNASMHLQNCTLYNNTVSLNGGAVVLDQQARLVARRCVISHNKCDARGGGLFASTNASMQLQHCQVVNNGAGHIGGGISLTDSAALTMVNTAVTSNAAVVGGGGVLLVSPNFAWDEVQAAVHGNTAPEAADISVWPNRLAVVDNSSINNFVSRLSSDDGLVNVTLNVTGAQGLPAEGWLLFASLDGLVVQQDTSGAGGLAHMHVKLRKPPGLYVLNFSLGGDANADVPAVQVRVHVVNCTQGDVTVSTGDACQTCARGQYSFDPRNSTCDQCVPNAECPGGAAVLALPGFWLSSPRSVQVHRCFNQDACLGGSPAAQQAPMQDCKSAQCAQGYHGNLCALCQQGYGTMKPFTCRTCMKPIVTVILYVLAALAMLVAVRVLSSFTLAEATPASTTHQATPVDLLKPLVVYLQWLFVVVSLNGIPWPPSLSVPLQALAWFWSSASANSLGLDCVLPHHAKLPVAMQKVLFGLLMPLAILLVLLCFDLLLALCARRRSQRWLVRHVSLRDRCLSLLLCMAYIFLPTWMHAIFSLFTCVPLDVEAAFPYAAEAVGSYWAQDMGAQCYAGYHRGWALGLGVPLLVLFCFVLPCGLFVFMYVSRRQGKLGQTSFCKQYGFLYRTWREPVCWWEAVVMLQTIVLVMIGTFGYAVGPYYQSLVITAALSIIIVLLAAVQPHCCHAARIVSLRSVGALMTTAFSALTFMPYRNISPAAGYTMAMGVFVLMINVVFVLTTVWQLLQLTDWSACKRVLALCCRKLAPWYCSGRVPFADCHCKSVFHFPGLQIWSSALAARCCSKLQAARVTTLARAPVSSCQPVAG